MADDLKENINEAAQKPSYIMVDGVQVRQHPIKDKIAADQYTKAQDAAAKPHFGIRLGRMVPPGGC
jgi:hypothetical protein